MSQWNDVRKLQAAYGSHRIQMDADYIGAYIFETAPADPTDLVSEESEWDKLPKAPPPISGYRDADIQGVACWNCGHFTMVGDPDDDGDMDGICCLFESQADATKTCDRFTAHADMLRQGPHTSWQEDLADMQGAMGPSIMEANYADNAVLNAIQLSASDAVEEDGLIWKDIMRTGAWKGTPTKDGVVKRALNIVRDGISSPAEGVISLSEILDNFDAGAVQYVTVPLSDDLEDHKNIARLNTGYVKKLKLLDRDGMSVLRAGFDFTEPDVKEKVLRGTIPDVSAGIPFGVTRRSDNKTFGAVLDHVCLTRKPFMSDLGPFGIAAADGEDLPVEAFEQEEVEAVSSPVPNQLPPTTSEEENEPEVVSLSNRQLENAIANALQNQLRLSSEYFIADVNGDTAIVSHRTSRSSWEVPFNRTADAESPVVLRGVDSWKLIEENQPTEVAASEPVDELTRARELRELRLSQPTSTGGINMPALSLDGVELSELPEEARNRIQSIVEDNQRLSRTNRESEVEKRIEALKALGFADRPGALKFYRQVMLDDDQGAALVLFSDKPESERERVTAIQILDRFIDALKGADGVQFSDQHFESGNDNRPPTDASGEKKPLEDRLADAQTALYGDKNKRRTGRK